jgi:LysR family hydrogen peroxide-inducible transcriptional activator
MVAAGVGVTLLPRLAVAPPVPSSDAIRILDFTEPVPSRTVAMFWRRTSAYRAFLPLLAEQFRRLPEGLVTSAPPSPAVTPANLSARQP